MLRIVAYVPFSFTAETANLLTLKLMPCSSYYSIISIVLSSYFGANFPRITCGNFILGFRGVWDIFSELVALDFH